MTSPRQDGNRHSNLYSRYANQLSSCGFRRQGSDQHPNEQGVLRRAISQGSRLSRTLRWLLELTLPRHDDATSWKSTKHPKSHKENLVSHFDGLCPLAAPPGESR
jgi:hypothetical protein